MTTLRKAAEGAFATLALFSVGEKPSDSTVIDVIAKLLAALAQPEQEPDDTDAIIIEYHEASIKRLEKRVIELELALCQRHFVQTDPAQPEQGAMQKEALLLALEYLQLQKLYGPAIGFGNTTIDDAIAKCKHGIGG
jgi:hypothetical protein